MGLENEASFPLHVPLTERVSVTNAQGTVGFGASRDGESKENKAQKDEKRQK